MPRYVLRYVLTWFNSLVTTKSDFFNSLLVGTLKSTLNKRDQTTAARIITKTLRQTQITPVLKCSVFEHFKTTIENQSISLDYYAK